MSWSKSSAKRLFSFGRKYSLSELSLMQMFKANGNWKGIKRLTGGKISKSTALSYGRLANQYIEHLSNPRPNDKVEFKTMFGEDIVDSKTPHENLKENLDIVEKWRSPPPPPPPPPRSRLAQILDRPWLRYWENSRKAQVENMNKPLSRQDLNNFKSYVVLSNSVVNSLRSLGVNVARIFAKLNFVSGNSQFVSTEIYDISDYNVPLEFLNKIRFDPSMLGQDILDNMVYDKFDYKDMKAKREKVKNVEVVFIRWYRD